ncbi:hypothetical protein FE257_007752 [Aspergillus nanangensis]|uniref:Peptidase M12B domain-containing protein n=1 Tax=Aspergillus nanangensis TaxID=2582783 RepID=A0AAD4GZ03_ASPNN|nr:hypothetical protein FE257_007752 [Aspergillus nanangensis]
MRVSNFFFTAATVLSLASHISARRLETSAFRLDQPVIHAAPSSSHRLPSQFNITAGIVGKDQNLAFVLESNHHVASPDTHVQYLDVDGNTNPIDTSFYQTTKGSAWLQSTGRAWKEVGWARIVVIRTGKDPLFEGTFTVKSTHYDIRLQNPIIQGSENDDNNRLMVYRTPSSPSRFLDSSSGAIDPPPRCMSAPRAAAPGLSLLPRDNRDLLNTINSTAGCPQTRQVAYIGVATDCSYSAGFSSPDAVHRNILNLVNTASVVFETSFNISLGLRNLTIADSRCPNRSSEYMAWNSACPNGDMNWRLQRFSSWRGAVQDTTNAYWTLMTDCHNSGGEVGVSWVGELCNSGEEGRRFDRSAAGIGANVVARTSAQWQVFTHEAAHMFGAIHDCNTDACASHLNTLTSSSQCCPRSPSSCDADGAFIMNPSSSRAMSRFSACTRGDVCAQLGSGSVNTQCLVPVTAIEGINMTGVNSGRAGGTVLR